MQACTLPAQAPAAPRPLRLTDLPDPEPGPDEVLVAVSACGVCRTDLHVVEGDLPLRATPTIPGHQAVGRVVRAAGGLAAGDRVGVAWLHRTCGLCRFCTSGRE